MAALLIAVAGIGQPALAEAVAPAIERCCYTPRTTPLVGDALAGGRHSGFLNNYAGRSPTEIQRGIRSIERQIDDHLSWINDPHRKIPKWDELDPRQQEALLTQKWPGDIQRQREQ